MLALQLISEAKRTNAKYLDIGNCGLTELPKALFELTQLEVLIVSNRWRHREKGEWQESENKGAPNCLSAIPVEIGQLQALRVLRLSGDWKQKWNIQRIEHLQTLTHLTTLDLRFNQIQKIENLDKLHQLTKLDLSKNQIQNIENLDNLHQLTTLDLRFNQIQKIENLDKLHQLTKLDLSKNQIQNIENLDNLHQLTTLDLSSNKIQNIENLDKLKLLTELKLGNNQIQNIENLDNLHQLTTLDLRYNQIQNIENLDQLHQLTTLYLSKNQIQNIELTNSLHQLTTLYLNYNQIQKIELTNSLHQLTTLYLNYNQIQNIELTNSLHQLTTLDLSRNQIQKIENLDKLKLLTELKLWNNQIQNIESLDNLHQLTTLDLSSNQIQNIENLDNLHQLTTLDLNYNQIQNIENLDNLHQLTTLDLSKNQIQNIELTNSLHQLTTLYLNYNQIQNIELTNSLHQLTTLDLSKNQIQNIELTNSLHQLTTLDLSKNQIQKIENLDQLHQLTTLDLRSNKIQNIELTNSLHQLTTLDLSKNQIQNIELTNSLHQLTTLDLSKNQIQNIENLDNLHQLTTLDLSSNQIQNIENLDQLHQLTTLYLSSNQIQNIENLDQLHQLTTLDLSSNQIQNIENLDQLHQLTTLDLSSNQITYFDELLFKHFPQLSDLKLAKNPIKNIPKEIYDKEYTNVLQKVQHYFQAVKHKSTLNTDLKLILIGNGRVGKSCLLDYWLGKPYDAHKASTHAIQLATWRITDTQLLASYPTLATLPKLQFQVWDFGGQHLYHATHRLFLQSQAIFVLLWDWEQENQSHQPDTYGDAEFPNHPLSYWLDFVQVQSPDSPVVIARNKVDYRDAVTHPRRTALDQYYRQQIADWQRISVRRKRHLSGLQETLLELAGEQIASSPPLPDQWVQIRQCIRQQEKASTKALLPTQFSQVCAEQGIHDPAHQQTVLTYLHDTGVLFYQKDLFQNRIIIDQKWAIDAVYTLLDREKGAFYHHKAKCGRLSGADIARHWQSHHYTEAEQELLIGFMLSCHLCFEYSERYINQNCDRVPLLQRQYIAPILLPEEMPSLLAKYWKKLPSKKYILHQYHFLHEGILHRFMAHAKEWLADPTEIWRTGIALTKGDTEVLVTADYTHRQIRLVMAHTSATAFDTEFPQELNKLFKEGRDDHSLASISYALNEQDYVSHQALSPCFETGQLDTHLRSTSNKLVRADDFACFFNTRNHTGNHTGDGVLKGLHLLNPLNTLIVVLYHQKDNTARKRLRIHLKPSENSQMIQVWDKRSLSAGAETKKQVLQKLKQAKIVICLLSADFLASDFYTEQVEPMLKSNASHQSFVPVLWSECLWEETPFYQLEAVPKSKRWIAPIKRKKQDVFWLEVVREVLEVVRLSSG